MSLTLGTHLEDAQFEAAVIVGPCTVIHPTLAAATDLVYLVFTHFHHMLFSVYACIIQSIAHDVNQFFPGFFDGVVAAHVVGSIVESNIELAVARTGFCVQACFAYTGDHSHGLISHTVSLTK